MPQAVTHILVPILLAAIFRDFYLRKNQKAHFPLHYVLLAGLGGVLPDVDIPISFLLNYLEAEPWDIHRTFSHSLIFPLIFLILYFLLKPMHKKARICNLGRHNLKLGNIFLILFFGTLIHIILDWIFPYFVNIFPSVVRSYVAPTLDGVLLIIWIVLIVVN